MAHEIASSKSLYRETVSFRMVNLDPTVLVVPKVHTYQHDIESLWWLTLWIVMCNVGHDPSAQKAEPVFRKRVAMTSARERVFLEVGRFTALIGTLRPELRTFGPILNFIRLLLLTCYTNRKPQNIGVENTYAQVMACHLQFFEHLEKSRDHWGAVDISPKSPRPSAAVVATTAASFSASGTWL